MEAKEIFITITGLKENGIPFKVGQDLILQKDMENEDAEAVAVYFQDDREEPIIVEVGQVANSVGTIARGTYSAGRLYDKIGNTGICRVYFVLKEAVIAKVIFEEPKVQEEKQLEEPEEIEKPEESDELEFPTNLNW